MKMWLKFDQIPGPDSCKFIELEDDQGFSMGKEQSGADWSEQFGQASLGPFARYDEHEELILLVNEYLDSEGHSEYLFNEMKAFLKGIRRRE